MGATHHEDTMDVSIFEIVMLLCFGAVWPFSIYTSYTSRSNAGKSIVFLFVILVGYGAGCVHKMLYHFDPVIFLYAFNGSLISVDIALYFRNAASDGKKR